MYNLFRYSHVFLLRKTIPSFLIVMQCVIDLFKSILYCSMEIVFDITLLNNKTVDFDFLFADCSLHCIYCKPVLFSPSWN